MDKTFFFIYACERSGYQSVYVSIYKHGTEKLFPRYLSTHPLITTCTNQLYIIMTNYYKNLRNTKDNGPDYLEQLFTELSWKVYYNERPVTRYLTITCKITLQDIVGAHR